MTQAGVYKLSLYEAKNLQFTYDSEGNVDSVSNTGEILEFNTESNTAFQNSLDSAFNNLLKNSYTINLNLFGLENITEVEKLNNSIYGWVSVFEFLDGQKKIIPIPVFGSSETVNTNTSHSYSIVLKPRKAVNKEIVDFV